MNPTARAKPPLPPPNRVRAAPPPLPADLGFAAKIFAEVDRFDAPRSDREARAQFAPAHPLPKPSLCQDLALAQRVIVTLPPPVAHPTLELQQASLPPRARAPRWTRAAALAVGAGVLVGLAAQAFAW